MELQDQITIPTPEGIDLTVVLAGVGSRGAAVTIDLLIQFAVTTLLFLGLAVANTQSGVVTAVWLIVVFLIFFGYFPLFEAFGSGKTPGKRALGIRVLRLDGGPLTFWRALVRNLLRLIDQLPTAYLVGIVVVLATERNQRLGDLAAGTVVVRDRRADDPLGTRHASDPSASPAAWAAAAAATPAPLPPEAIGWDLSRVSPSEVAAVRTFLDRRWSLDPAVRAQLAADFANRLRPNVVGPPLDEGPERFLEWIVYVKHYRG